MPWIVQGWIIVTHFILASISHPARAFNLCKTPLLAFLTNASRCKNIPHILYSFLWLLVQFGFSFKILFFGFKAINDSFGQDTLHEYSKSLQWIDWSSPKIEVQTMGWSHFCSWRSTTLEQVTPRHLHCPPLQKLFTWNGFQYIVKLWDFPSVFMEHFLFLL